MPLRRPVKYAEPVLPHIDGGGLRQSREVTWIAKLELGIGAVFSSSCGASTERACTPLRRHGVMRCLLREVVTIVERNGGDHDGWGATVEAQTTTKWSSSRPQFGFEAPSSFGIRCLGAVHRPCRRFLELSA